MRVNVKLYNFCFCVAIIVLSAVFVPQLSHADTEATGVIHEPVVWTVAQSPIVINGDFGVATDGSLAIEPGVIVKFGPGAQLLSGGGWIKANGTIDHPIIFTSASDTPHAGDWNRISLTNFGDEISFAKFEYGSSCLDVFGAVNISHVEIKNCEKGIFLRTDFAGIIEDSKFSNNTYGLYLSGNANPTIEHNRINDNQYGIYIESSLAPSIINNDIIDNSNGIAAGFADGEISENNIAGNTEFGIKNLGFHILNARNDWWGHADGPYNPLIRPTGLGDKVDMIINFAPWASGPFDNFVDWEWIIPPPDDDPPVDPPGDSDPPDDPEPEPSGPRPVLIIPGIMGSELYEGDNFIWPNVNRLLLNPNDGFLSESLSLDESGNSIKNITVGDIVRDILVREGPIVISNTDMFTGLINNLTEDGYIADINLFVFPYDWRLDLGNAQVLLDQKIEQIKNQTGFSKVDIIAHSMGGLVAQDYIAHSGTASVDDLIFVGVPHLGAPKAAMALLTGDIDAPRKTINASRVKEIAQNSPAIYQLLPNSKYFEVYQGYIKVVPEYGILDYDQSLEFLADSGKNISLLNLAHSFFNQELYDLNFGDIRVFNIVGCNRASTKNIIPINGANGRLLTPIYSNGDGTVPFVSADYISPHATAYYVKGGRHAELPSMNGVRQLIAGILEGQENLSSNVSRDAVSCPINGKELNWRSPVTVQIYDEAGNHTGILPDGTIEENIPGSVYEIIDGELYIFLPTDEGQTYTIEGTGIADSSFDLIVSEINNDEVVNNTLFDNIHIVPGSSISFTVSETSDNNQITSDNNTVVSTSQFSDPADALIEANNTLPDSPSASSPTSSGGGGGSSYSQPLPDSGRILGETTTRLPDGMVVMDTADSRTIYIIGNGGKKYGFTNEGAFLGMGFKFESVLLGDLTRYELAGVIAYPDQIHPNGSLVWDGHTIWFINYEKRHGFATMEEFTLAGFELKQVIKMNQADLLLEEN